MKELKRDVKRIVKTLNGIRAELHLLQDYGLEDFGLYQDLLLTIEKQLCKEIKISISDVLKKGC